MPYTVYTMTNTDDTHIYVGCTKNYERRFYGHMYECKCGRHPNRHVQALYNQIGPDGFEFDVVEEFDTKAEAREAEQRWVDYYLAAPEWQLMNIATENVNNPMSNPEVAAKVAAANTGRACSATTKAKISAAITGTKRSKVTKAKMSAAMKGKNDKPVYIKWADGTETEIESLTEAISLIGVSSGLVSMWCNGSSTTYTKPKYGIAEIRYL